MNLNKIVRKRNGSVFITGLLLTLSGTVYGHTMESEAAPSLGKIYIGVFGGAGSGKADNLSQFGTAFFIEAEGGPLAVNAFGGKSDSTSAGFIGVQLGYAWPEQLWSSPTWTLIPAAELEGYYLSGSTFEGHDLNNDTTSLPEHDFYVTYPTKTSVFLINAVLNMSHCSFGIVHPYIGLGIGSAVVSISGAHSGSISPAELGINHYNSDTKDTAYTFAAQPKIGVNFDIAPQTSVFVEYRYLYLAATDYTFGSTVYPTHAVTSEWFVKTGAQRYNLGGIGIKYDFC